MSIQVASRRNILLLFVIAVTAMAATMLYTGVASGDGEGDGERVKRYEISITNLTKGQIISPVVVAAHAGSLPPIYTLGSPASDELAKVAEDAMLADFIAMLEAEPSVASVGTVFGENGPIFPGETATLVFESEDRARSLSLAAMLVTTNDTFIGLSGVSLPRRNPVMHFSPGYDAGTEANNEDCDFIPGPPCGNGGVRDTEGAEGFVYIGNGVQGIADLDVAQHDWNNPAAKITVRRLSGDENTDVPR